jgi:ABC-type transport system involved in multi-copper enzyme maturation permease subunit
LIPVLLRDLLPRLLIVALAGLMFYLLEPAFHQHDLGGGDVLVDIPPELGPLGVAATLANLAGLTMVILLAGFVSNDRRRGYYRTYLSHPVNPLALYGLRWALALGVTLLASALFLVLGQWAAWGTVRGGGEGLLLALLSALVYGSLIAFLSAILPRGDAWVAILIFFFTFFWIQVLAVGAEPLNAPLRQVITFVLPPQMPLQDIYAAMMMGTTAWGAVAFVVGYALFWLVAAGLVLRLREWP